MDDVRGIAEKQQHRRGNIVVEATQKTLKDVKEGRLKTSSRKSSGRSSGRSSSKEGTKKVKKIKINVFVQTNWLGETVIMEIEEDKTIGELKKAICTEHGYLPDEFWLMDAHSGVPIDDVLGFPDCGIKHDSNVRLAPRSHGGVSPKKRKPDISIEDAVEAMRYEEEAAEVDAFSVKASEEDIENAVRDTLKKALTRGDLGHPLSGGYRVRDLPSPKGAHREHARKLAQDKAKKLAHSDHNPKESSQDLASQVSEGFQHLFPSMFLGCTPTVARKHNYGGAPTGAKPPSWAGA